MKQNTRKLRAACNRALLENHSKAVVARFENAATDSWWPLPQLTPDEAKIICNSVWDDDFRHPRQMKKANLAIANDLSDRIDALQKHLDFTDEENIKIFLVYHMLYRRFTEMAPASATRCYAAVWLLQFAPYGTDLREFLEIVETHIPVPATASED